jgi:predicted CXXCH cytochrome family protein
MDWVTLASLVLLAAASVTETEIEMGPHQHLGCEPCHVTNAEGRPIGPISMIHDQDAICLPCHDGVSAPHPRPHPFVVFHTHPFSDITPAFVYPTHPLPSNYPLDERGRVTCSTCHAVHSNAPVLLRSTEPWNCILCHPNR